MYEIDNYELPFGNLPINNTILVVLYVLGVLSVGVPSLILTIMGIQWYISWRDLQIGHHMDYMCQYPLYLFAFVLNGESMLMIRLIRAKYAAVTFHLVLCLGGFAMLTYQLFLNDDCLVSLYDSRSFHTRNFVWGCYVAQLILSLQLGGFRRIREFSYRLRTCIHAIGGIFCFIVESCEIQIRFTLICEWRNHTVPYKTGQPLPTYESLLWQPMVIQLLISLYVMVVLMICLIPYFEWSYFMTTSYVLRPVRHVEEKGPRLINFSNYPVKKSSRRDTISIL